MTPRVDIICLVHNGLPVTRGFVKSIFANTSNFRLIFIDNGSTDGTPEFLKEGEDQGQWKVVSPGKNLGVIGGRNLGVQHVESEFFMNIDNDQYPGPGWLDGLFGLIDKGYDIVGPEAWELMPPKASGALVVGGQVVSDRSYFPYKHCKRSNDKFTYVGCGGSLIKASVYKKIGLFDERFNPAYFEDPDFCYDRITQVLTKKSLKYIKDVIYSDEILTLSDDGKIEYKEPDNIIKKHEKELLHFNNRRVDIMCSKEQKLLVGYHRPAWKHDKGDFREIDFVSAAAINAKLSRKESRHFVRTALGDWRGVDADFVQLGKFKFKYHDFACFMGWYLSEGCVCYDLSKAKLRNDNQIHIGQQGINKTKIAEVIKKLGFSPSEYQNGVAFYNTDFSHYLRQFGKSYEKSVPYIIRMAKKTVIQSFLDAYIQGDGTFRDNKFSIYTSSDRMKGDLVDLLVKTGHPFTFSLQNGGNMKFSNGTYNCRPCWNIQSYDNSKRENTRAYLPKAEIVDYDDMVYDITVPNHRIFIVRNGKGCWSSNCFRALLAGFKLGWHCKCPITHLAHQTFNSQQLFNKNTQFQKSWKAFKDKWHPYFPEPTKMPKAN